MRFFILFFLLLSCCLNANVLDTMQNISTRNTTLPLYNKDELQAILFGQEIKRSGRLLLVSGPCIDIVRKNADLQHIRTGGAKIYPLNAPIKEVMNFWKQRILFSDGVVSSTHADVDQSMRQAFGKEKVFFRSPAIDIDGIGYHANYKERHCLIKSNVKITIRNGASDIRQILKSNTIPKKLNLVNAVSNELFIHLKKGEIILTGNVVIQEPKGTIKCDKMVILLDRSQKDEKNSALHGSSVKEINCYGNIQIDMNDKADNDDDSGAAIKFFGFHDAKKQFLDSANTAVFCNAPTDSSGAKSMTISGTRVNAKQMRWDFQKNILQFRRDVRIRDRRLNLDCGDLKIYLGKKNKNAKNTVSKIEASVAVNLIDKDYQLNADRMILYFPPDKPIAEGPDDVLAFGNVLITYVRRDSKGNAVSKSTLASDKASLFRLKNKAIFIGNVKVRDDAFHLDSDQLHLFAEKYPSGTVFPPTPKGEAPKRIRLNDELELKHITAYKNVKIFRKDEAGDEKALGDRADYYIKHRKITLVGTPEKPPVLYKGENLLATEANSKIIVDLAEQIASTVGSGAELQIKEKPKKRK
jgi:lipopolysaccharide export system protein LptA